MRTIEQFAQCANPGADLSGSAFLAALVQHNFQITWDSEVIVANDFLALAIFLAAAFTDLLDGYLARRWKQITTVGTLLDPIADKLLISAALVSLVEMRLLPGWMVILIISREFAVSGLRSIAAAEGYTIKAGDAGKWKMVFQVIGVALVMMSVRWAALRPYSMAAMWAVVIFGVWSAIDYLRKFWRKVDDSIKLRRRNELITMERDKRRQERAQRIIRAKARRARRSGSTEPSS